MAGGGSGGPEPHLGTWEWADGPPSWEKNACPICSTPQLSQPHLPASSRSELALLQPVNVVGELERGPQL